MRRIIRESGAKAKAKSDDAALRAKRRDLKAREVALQLAAELRAKRKDLKARDTAHGARASPARLEEPPEAGLSFTPNPAARTLWT